MESKRFREEPSLEVQLAFTTTELSTDIAEELLKRAEVRDALNFSIASSNDPRFTEIREIMNQEYIWKFWFNRDLSIISKDELYPIDWIDHPLKWKTYYLWYRLMIARMQFSVLTRLYNINLPPQPYTYKRLNVAELNGNLFDFKPLFISCMEQVNDGRLKKENGYDLHNLFVITNTFGTRERKKSFLIGQYKFASSQIADMYNNILDVLEHTNMKNYFQYLSAPPRLIELTSLLVASCLTCGMAGDDLQKEENNSTHIFCNENCQLAFYKK